MCKLKSWKVIKKQHRWGLQGQAGRQMKRQTHMRTLPEPEPCCRDRLGVSWWVGVWWWGGWVDGGEDENETRERPQGEESSSNYPISWWDLF